MKEYLVLIVGSGESCDYTIDCNKTWWRVKARNMKEAIEKVMGTHPSDLTDEEMDDEDFFCYLDGIDWSRYNSDEEPSYESLEILEISKSEDLGPICENFQNSYELRKNKRRKNRQEEKERAEYERLKAKFEK